MAEVLRLDVDMQNIQLMKYLKLFLQNFNDVLIYSKQRLAFLHRELNAVLKDQQVEPEDRHDLRPNFQNSRNFEKGILLDHYYERIEKIFGLESGALDDSLGLVYIVVVDGSKGAGLALQVMRVIFGRAIA